MTILNGKPALYATTRKGDKIVCFGDSLTSTNANANYSYPRVLSWLTSQAIVAAGVVGNTLTQMIARIKTSVIDKEPSMCIVLGGTNDIGAGDTAATVIGRMTTITNILLQYNIEPVWCLIPPRSDNEALLPVIRNVNDWLYAYCIAKGITCVDLYTTFADTDGTVNASYFSTDNLHFNAAGKRLCAQTIYDKLVFRNRVARYAPLGDALNKLANCEFATDTDANGMSDSWSITNPQSLIAPNIAYTREDNASGGKLQTISKLVTGSASQVGFYQTPSPISPSKTYHFSADVVFAGTPTGADDDMTFSVYLKHFTSGSVEISTTWVARYVGDSAFTQMRVWHVFTTPATTGKTQVMFTCVGKGAATVSAGRVRLVELPVTVDTVFND